MVDINRFAVMGYAKGITLWSYSPPHSRTEDILNDGHFNAAAHLLRRGDWILCGGPNIAHTILGVTENDGRNVRVAVVACAQPAGPPQQVAKADAPGSRIVQTSGHGNTVTFG